jgi:hypothetical protein
MACIKWLNDNQGFVMALLTLVYVITTVAIALLTLRATNLSKKHLETAIDLEKNRLRPYVIFNISSSTITRSTFVSIKNLGLTAAYNIKVSITPKLIHSFADEKESAFTASNILFLPPNEEVNDVLGLSADFHQKYPEPIFKGKIEYEDIEKNKYTESLHIDLNFLRHRIYTGAKTVEGELEKLNKTLVTISEQLEEPE